ncbi:MAG: hypothetical protein U0798_20730 [Gemmataceae bacterium]
MRAFQLLLIAPVVFLSSSIAWGQGSYQKKGTRAETGRATLISFGLPTLSGQWKMMGPFDNTDGKGIDAVYAPEKGVDFKATAKGKRGAELKWKDVPLTCGQPLDLLSYYAEDPNNLVCYLALQFESKVAVKLPVSLGADDTLSVFFNGKRLLHENHERAVSADQYRVVLDVVKGSNTLLLKVGQYAGQYAVFVEPLLPESLPAAVRKEYLNDFRSSAAGEVSASQTSGAESAYYSLSTIEPPADCVLEVGGLAFRPDGQLLATTRRGEIWRIENPAAASPGETKFHLYATGLHEPLGIHVVNNNECYVIQRPELTKLTDRSGKGMADEFDTICNRFGVSGDYHEYAYGPALGKDGYFYVTLNVGFGGGHQAKVPWRGWCVRINPKTGSMEPWAYGLRSPNGVNFSPEGELFYADNQGEWVATNKLTHIQKGEFYGHQASLKWLSQSPFKDRPEKVLSGMRYDAEKAPDLTPPAIWFPYGRMGQSASEPIWDTTGGKFGPFAGQCFIGDQTRSTVMRVAMEKVNGKYQGACFPFRSGLQCGVNRLVFGPDGSLYAGQTNRGWGSVGGKPYGLQRIAYNGKAPLEIHHVKLTKTGFDLTFTGPIDPKTIANAAKVKSFTYTYHSSYGCPEIDPRAETVSNPKLSKDGKTLSFDCTGIARGRIYEIRLSDVADAKGEAVLHPEAYYTVNELVK